MAAANIFSAAGLDLLHLDITPPLGRITKAVAFQPFQGECKIFRITLVCSLPFRSRPHERRFSRALGRAASLQTARTSRGSSCLQETHKRDNASLLSDLLCFRKYNCAYKNMIYVNINEFIYE